MCLQLVVGVDRTLVLRVHLGLDYDIWSVVCPRNVCGAIAQPPRNHVQSEANEGRSPNVIGGDLCLSDECSRRFGHISI
jgi:hypothetical protein